MATFTNEVLVLTSITKLTTTLVGRRSVEVQNLGPNAIYVSVDSAGGGGAAAVASKSRKVGVGESWSLDLPPGRDLYAITSVNQVTTAATVVTEVD